MRGKYGPLYEHLKALQVTSERTTFSRVERVIGCSLPPSARRWREWWANDSSQVQAQAWLTAGWETAAVDMEAETFTFRRVR